MIGFSQPTWQENLVQSLVDSKILVPIMRTSSLLRQQRKSVKSSLKDRRNNRLVWVPVLGQRSLA
jgi:hypothetical protein